MSLIISQLNASMLDKPELKPSAFNRQINPSVDQCGWFQFQVYIKLRSVPINQER